MMRLKDSGRVKKVSRRAAALTVPVADLAAAARGWMRDLSDRMGLELMRLAVEHERLSVTEGPDRVGYKWGNQPGYSFLGGRKVAFANQGVRSSDEEEVPLRSYRKFQEDGNQGRLALREMLRGVSTRDYRDNLVKFPAVSKHLIMFSVVTFILIYLSGFSQAATYYVSNSGSATWAQCTDINTPCPATTAMANAQAGDIVYFRGGTYQVGQSSGYNAMLQPTNSGTAINPILFQAYPGDQPVVINANVDAGRDNSNAIGNGMKDYIIWDGFTIQANNGLKMGSILIYGNPVNRSTGCQIKNSIINGGTTHIPTNDNRDGIRIENSNYVLIQGNKIFNINHTTTSYEDISGIKFYHTSFVTIENNEFYDSPNGTAIGIKSDGDDTIVRYNFIHDCNRAIYGNPSMEVMATDRVKIYHNLIINCTFGGITFSHNDSHTNNYEIYNNTLYNTNRGIALGPGSAGNGHKIYNNIISNVTYRSLNLQYDSTLIESDYNAWDSNNISIVMRQYSGNSVTYSSLASWQASTEIDGGLPPDTHSVSSTPSLLFKNASGTLSQLFDFKLATNSPSKGTGKGGVDMGADIPEVGTGAPSPPMNLRLQ